MVLYVLLLLHVLSLHPLGGVFSALFCFFVSYPRQHNIYTIFFIRVVANQRRENIVVDLCATCVIFFFCDFCVCVMRGVLV